MKIAPLTEADRSTAAQLYWLANRPVLGRVMGPDRKAVELIHAALTPAYAIGAYHDARLIGIAGFRDAGGAFCDLTRAPFSAVYGPLSGRMRALALRSIPSDTDNLNFINDTLSILPDHQGRGVGTALIAALSERAASHAALRLDVADTNPRAMALYLRLGFTPQRAFGMGPLSALFGAASRIPMLRVSPRR